MTELFERLLPTALKCGIGVVEYWDLTIGEIRTVVLNYQHEQELKAKEAIVTNYNLATMVSSFVMNGMNGKSNPSLLELFPDMFQEELQKQKEEEDARYWQLYKEQMLDFAAAHNKKRAKESEENKQ